MDRSGASHVDHLASARRFQSEPGSRLDHPVLCSTLIGRGAHLETLHRLSTKASSGHGGTLLIAGEAGIGKSRLVAEARAEVGLLNLTGNCFEPDRRLPFAPIVDLVRSHIAGSNPEQTIELLGTTAKEIVKLLPELSSLLPAAIPNPQLGSEQEKRRLTHSLLDFLSGRAQSRPALIVIEDIHWSDTTSLEFLLQLSRRVRDWPALLLLTYRSDETQPDLNHFLASIVRERLASEILLDPLSVDQTETMLQTMFDQHRPVRAEFLDTVWQLTEGNPFFIEEVLKSLVSVGDIFFSDGAWDRKALRELRISRTIQDAVRQRLVPLSPEARQVLVLAAVAGRRFDFRLLQEISGCNEDQLLTLMKELISAQLVIEESADRFAFRHALTRQAIYAELLGRERKSLHAAIGTTLERLYVESLDAHLADLAYHFFEGGEWEQALQYARHAGENAYDLYSPRAAIEHFSYALDAAARLNRPAPSDILRMRGKAHEWVGAFDLARRDFEAVLAGAAEDKRKEWMALIDLGILWSGRNYDTGGHYYDRAYASAQSISDPTLLAHSLNRIGNWRLRVEALHDARQHHQQAQRIFTELGDRRGVAETLNLLGTAHHVGGNLARAHRCFHEAVTIYREIDDRQGLVFSMATMAVQGPAYQSDTVVPAIDLTHAAQEGERALDTARDIGWRAGEAYALLRLGCCLGAQGSYGRALDTATKGFDIAEEIQHRQWMAAAGCGLGALHLDLLDAPSARRWLEPAYAWSAEIGSRFWLRSAGSYLAQGCILDGDLDHADEILRPVLDEPTPIDTLAQRLAWHTVAELALARNQPARALEIAERLIASSGGTGVVPRLTLLRGRALLALNRHELAHADLKSALSTAVEQDTLPLVWRAQHALGQFAEASETLLRLATTIFDSSLRKAYLQRASRLYPQPGGERMLRAAKSRFDGLTARERDVATLIAQGKTNRAIATALTVSERTIETHVSNILNKLSFTSRSQIAAWAVRKGLSGDDE